MFKKFATEVRESFIKLLTSLKRFPEAILLATATVIILMFLNHLRYSDETSIRDTLGKVAAILALGIPLYLNIRLFYERKPMLNHWPKLFLYLGVIIGLVFYYCYGFKNFNMVSLSRYMALSLAFYLIFLSIPYFYKREHFELYCVQILTDFVITYFYALILYLGISAILFTINKLFSISLTGAIYFDLWLTVAGIFAPAYFLAEVPSLQTEFQPEHYPKVLKVLFLYIIIPLIIMYSLILYVYFGKIIITRTWPAGIVSHLVLWYGLICNGVFFCIFPLRFQIKWIDKLLKIFPGFLFPLLAMMFVSMGIRIRAYGITESRYFVILGGIWITGWILYYLLAKKVRNIILPVSLAILAILSVIGPWSAYAISKFDQNSRLTAILKKYDMLQNQRLTKPNHPISAKDKAEIISVLTYFNSYHTLRDVKYLPDNFKLNKMPEIFGFKSEQTNSDGQSYFNYQFVAGRNTQLTNIQGFDYFIRIPQTDIIRVNAAEKLRITYSSGTHELKITAHNQEIYKKKVSDLVIPLFKKGIPTGGKAVRYLDETAKVKVFYDFDTVSGQNDLATGQINVNFINFEVFIKLK
jgi:hypothetical protein